ncbi:hypothetical protein [Streptomyces sp. IB2014 016-6]|uniref:hypothetical protein n=1 Tax=Streptomyces sp. IB2014 016-6 TaxID=2517818 RepID=UPI0011CA6307|nr:hypothetical protein [Streptomyces sp. IB2014 016-6]TXL87982.1 hypothetical protein EW053_20470 [Streptomyces sp. IB2014 016-6]
MGDHARAARAQFYFLSLKDTDRDRATAAHVLARLERRKGDLAAAEADDAPPARETMSHGKELLSTIARQHAKALGELSTRAKWAVAALQRDPG